MAKDKSTPDTHYAFHGAAQASQTGLSAGFSGQQLGKLHSLHQQLQTAGTLTQLAFENRQNICMATFLLSCHLDMRAIRITVAETRNKTDASYMITVSDNGVERDDQWIMTVSKQGEMPQDVIEQLKKTIKDEDAEAFRIQREGPLSHGSPKVTNIMTRRNEM